MTEIFDEFHLTKDDKKLVLEAIKQGHIATLDGEPYKIGDWEPFEGEAVHDWLEHNLRPKRAREIMRYLRNGNNVKSRPVSPTVAMALSVLNDRIKRLENEIAELKQNSKE